MPLLTLIDLPQPWDGIVVVAAAFALAWLASRWSERLAGRLVRRYERRHVDPEEATSGVMTSLKRHETTVSLMRTTVRYAAFGLALIVATGELTGQTRTTTVAWASLVVILVGFALQRFLTDILSGIFMVFEGWFSVGDTIVIEPWKLAGVVEEISLRAIRMRALNGETLRVSNSQILAMRVLPKGVVEVRIELFVREEEAGRRLVEEVARVVPVGPTDFTRAPWVEDSSALDDQLARIRARASVVAGREWLAHDFLVDVLKERAAAGLIVHGPVVLEVDEAAAQRYARSTLVRPTDPATPR